MPKVACLPSKITGAACLMALTLAYASAAFAQDRMKVVTTFTVLADMAANVAGDAADVVSITKPGAEIHGYEPTPGDIVAASDADLVLWNGLNLELWFEQFVANLGDIPSVTVSEGITPIPISSGSYEGKPNPHAWMGLENALIYIDNIEAAFAAQPYQVGQGVQLHWTPDQAHPLSVPAPAVAVAA